MRPVTTTPQNVEELKPSLPAPNSQHKPIQCNPNRSRKCKYLLVSISVAQTSKYTKPGITTCPRPDTRAFSLRKLAPRQVHTRHKTNSSRSQTHKSRQPIPQKKLRT